MQLIDMLETLTPADRNREFWVTSFVLNADPFKRYASNISPTRVVIQNLENIMGELKNHHEMCKPRAARLGYEYCRHHFEFQTVNTKGQRGAKLIKGVLYAGKVNRTPDYRYVELFDTKAEAKQRYEQLISEGIVQFNDYVSTYEDKLRNTLIAAQQL